MEELIKQLINSNIKLVSRETGIPYARMHKWTKGGGKPKIDDFNTLKEYFKREKIDKSKDTARDDDLNSTVDQLNRLRAEFLEKEKIYRELLAEKDKRLAEKDELIMVLKEQLSTKSDKASSASSDPRAVQR